MDVHVPQSEAALMAAILWERTRLKWRGVKYEPRAPSPATQDACLKHELYESLCSATQQYDPLRAALFQVRALGCALDSGEPMRLVRSLCSTANLVPMSGAPNAEQRAAELLRQAEELATEAVGGDHGQIAASRAIVSLFVGNIPETVEAAELAAPLLERHAQDEALGAYYRRSAVAAVRLGALYQLGRYVQFDREINAVLREANATDNRAFLLQLAVQETLHDIVQFDCARTRARLEKQRAELPRSGFGALHTLHLMSVMYIACHSGDRDWALATLDEYWGSFERSVFGRAGYLPWFSHMQRSCLLLNHHIARGCRGKLPSAIHDDLRWLNKHGGHAHAGACTVQLRLAHLSQDRELAVRCARKGMAARIDMGWQADAQRDRYVLGALLGGEEGRALRQAALHDLGAHGSVNPRAEIAMFYPEFMQDDAP